MGIAGTRHVLHASLSFGEYIRPFVVHRHIPTTYVSQNGNSAVNFNLLPGQVIHLETPKAGTYPKSKNEPPVASQSA
ncbi:hypothetical protein [Corynebacterium falsenii]